MKPLTRAALILTAFGGSYLLGSLAGFEYYESTPETIKHTVLQIEQFKIQGLTPQLNLGERRKLPFSGLLTLMCIASSGAGLWFLLPWLLGNEEETEEVEATAAPVQFPSIPVPPRIALDPTDPAFNCKLYQPESKPSESKADPLERLTDLLDKTKRGTDVEAVKHLMIEGSTGDGKSTFTGFLTHIIHGSWLVIDPHRKPSQWQGLTVLGGGRNYSEIARVLEGVHTLMTERYKLRDKGLDVGEVVNIVIDEYPAIAASDECKDIAPTVLKSLLREARKVGIRVILLVQGCEVKTLKIEGEGSVRKNMLHIHCGSVAKDFVKTKNASVYNRIKDLDYCYLLNGDYLPVPKLGNVPTNTKCLPLPSELQELISTEVYLEFNPTPVSPEVETLNKMFSLESVPNPVDTKPHRQELDTELTPEQSALYSYCLKKGKALSPRYIKQQTVKGLEACSTDDIREIIDSLISLGKGTWDGESYSV